MKSRILRFCLVVSMISLLPLLSACSKSKGCKAYHECCSALQGGDAATWKLLQSKTRCYAYEKSAKESVCLTEISRVVGELAKSGKTVPSECKLK